MHQSSKFEVPEPPARPNEKPDFSYLNIPEPGGLPQPPMDAPADHFSDYAKGLVRVLDDQGTAVPGWESLLPDTETKVAGLRAMIKTRLYDERMIKMQRVGKMSFYVQCTGEEAVAVSQSMALTASDMCFPTYRCQGWLVARNASLVEMMCHCLSNSKDRMKGRQLPVMYAFPEHQFFSISGNLGTQYPQAVGWAMAELYKGGNGVASAFIGDGSTAENDFHAALTFAATYNAPILLNITNNQWAISTFQNIAGGGSTFAARGLAYGLPSLRVDGNDFLACYAATQWAANRARQGHGATVIEFVTYRAAAHSTSDDPSKYRPKDEWSHWPLGCPIERLKSHLLTQAGWSETQHTAMVDEVAAEVTKAYKEAESYGTLSGGQRPEVATMFEQVYKDIPPDLIEQRRKLLGK
ncbi:MAG: thiamine pyrophosphate-dependent enzyme [Pseudomonadota bacterium]